MAFQLCSPCYRQLPLLHIPILLHGQAVAATCAHLSVGRPASTNRAGLCCRFINLTTSNTSCALYSRCFSEFCKDGSNYGYRLPGDTSACGSKPGPLIRMAPGSSYKLTLQNTAPDPLDKTNIHTHGLHISGSGDADDITRLAAGGSCLTYSWGIPSDHPGGTNW